MDRIYYSKAYTQGLLCENYTNRPLDAHIAIYQREPDSLTEVLGATSRFIKTILTLFNGGPLRPITIYQHDPDFVKWRPSAPHHIL